MITFTRLTTERVRLRKGESVDCQSFSKNRTVKSVNSGIAWEKIVFLLLTSLLLVGFHC